MKKDNYRTAIIGCGNLGKALAIGMIDGSISADRLEVTRRNTVVLRELAARGVSVHSENKDAVDRCELIILAVKPYNMDSILTEITPHIDPVRHVVVSVVTGISTAHIASFLPAGTPVFRAMPNTAADVKESLTCICYCHAGPVEIDIVNSVFSSMGSAIFINEELMEAATVMGACGIAFVMRFIRAMVQGGIEIGFDAKTAGLIVQQTVKGAAELLITRGGHPESEIDKVTTPKGCTIAGLNEMEHNGFSSALIKGIKSSYQKIEPV